MKVLNYYHIGKCIPHNAVYIGRANKKYNLPESKLANPFPITETTTREQSINNYRAYLWDSMKKGLISAHDILSLDGYDLVCYCNPKPCHGDVLIKAFEYLKNQNK